MSSVYDVLTAISTATPGNSVAAGLSLMEPSNASIRIYSYLLHFDMLWGLSTAAAGCATGSEQETDGERNGNNREHSGIRGVANALIRQGQMAHIIIVWDGLPESKDEDDQGIAPERFVTPLDWAAAVNLATSEAARKVGRESHAQPITIIDVYSCTDTELPVLRWLQAPNGAQLPGLPSVRVVRPNRVDGDRVLRGIVSGLTGAVPIPSEAAGACNVNAKRGVDERLVRAVWASMIASDDDSENRHALSNVVGPQLVLGHAPSGASASCRGLEEMLRGLGLLGEECEGEGGASLAIDWQCPPFDSALRMLQRSANSVAHSARREIRVYLVDDMWRSGWAEVLSDLLQCLPVVDSEEDGWQILAKTELLGGQFDASLRVARSADALLKLLDAEPDPSVLPVLFLDLRLFSGRSFVRSEVPFIKAIIARARALESAQLVWPAIPDAELHQVEQWLSKLGELAEPLTDNEIRRQDAYALYLTFLPRVTALLDPQLPIVVFSSTGQRKIVSRLAQYRTIYTAFQKPRLPMNSADEVARQRKLLREGMLHSLQVMAGRALISNVRSCRHRLSRMAARSDVGSHLALFLDESETAKGNPPRAVRATSDGRTSLVVPDREMVVGGLLFVGTAVGIEKICEGVQRSIGGLGMDGPGWNSDLRKAKLRENHTLRQLVPVLARQAEEHGVTMMLALLRSRPPEGAAQPSADRDPFASYGMGDNRHRAVLRKLVELALYGVGLHLVERTTSPTFAVAMGTRVVNVQALAEREALKRDWGLQSEPVGATAVFREALDTLEGWSRWAHRQNEEALPPTFIRSATGLIHALSGTLRKARLGRGRELIRTLDVQELRPIVEQIVMSYGNHIPKPRPTTARCYRLNTLPRSGEMGTGEYAQSIHYLTDALLHVAATGRRDARSVLKTLHIQEARDSRELEKLLEAHRHLHAGRDEGRPCAMVCCLDLSWTELEGQRLLHGILDELATNAGDLSGQELVLLWSKLAA